MNMNATSVSVIIPTYNGAHKILNILKALEQQTLKDFEVVIVIDGSTDNTAQIIKNNKFKLNLKIISRENGGRAIVRNVGAEESLGEFLIFFDDDMRPLPNCVENHIKHHSTYPESICVGTQEEDILRLKTDFQYFKYYIVNKWMMDLPPSGIAISQKDIYITAANFSISKDLFDRLGRFDERLTDAEDFELGTRADAMGISIYYNPNARAFHDDPVTCYSYIRRQREYATAHKRLHQLRPEIVGKFKNAQEYNPSFFKRIVFSLFANKFFVYTIDRINFYQFMLPKKARYKLYDIVVCGMAKVFPQRQM